MSGNAVGVVGVNARCAPLGCDDDDNRARIGENKQ